MKYDFIKEISGLVIIRPDIFHDRRGSFSETFNSDQFKEIVGNIEFVSEAESVSSYGVVRGLHYQADPFAQAKLIRVIRGRIIDVAVDIRKDSQTYGKHYWVPLSDFNRFNFYIPRGFAHGFSVMSDYAIVHYKFDSYYSPESQRGIRWDDPDLSIEWDIKNPVVSDKDRSLPLFGEI